MVDKYIIKKKKQYPKPKPIKTLCRRCHNEMCIERYCYKCKEIMKADNG